MTLSGEFLQACVYLLVRSTEIETSRLAVFLVCVVLLVRATEFER